MTTPLAKPALAGGKLVANLMHFARVLRRAGLPIGPGKVLAAVEAVTAVGIESRDDLYWTLHAVFVNRRDQKELFDQAFHVFWRNPKLLERMMALLLPEVRRPEGEAPEEIVKPPPAGSARRREQRPRRGRGRAAGAGSDRRCGDDLFRPRAPPEDGFRGDVGRGDASCQGGDAAVARPHHDAADEALPRRSGGTAHRHAGEPQEVAARRRQRHSPPAAPAARAPPSPRGTLRHLGLDEPLFAHVAPLPPCAHQRPRPRP